MGKLGSLNISKANKMYLKPDNCAYLFVLRAEAPGFGPQLLKMYFGLLIGFRFYFGYIPFFIYSFFFTYFNFSQYYFED